jgi:hypothetical protein
MILVPHPHTLFKICFNIILLSVPRTARWSFEFHIASSLTIHVQTKLFQEGLFQVTYGSLHVDNGNELTPTQVKDPPTVTWGADGGSYYLLCMTGTEATLVGPTFIPHIL